MFLNLSVHLNEKVFSLVPTEFFLSFAFLVSSKQGEMLLSLNFLSFSQSFQCQSVWIDYSLLASILGLLTKVLLIVYVFCYFSMHIGGVRIKTVCSYALFWTSFIVLKLFTYRYIYYKLFFDFKGIILLFSPLYSGTTPLHWAAMRGNLEACTVLVQAGKKEDLVVTDISGLTPAQLASDRKHRQVAFFLVSVL